MHRHNAIITMLMCMGYDLCILLMLVVVQGVWKPRQIDNPDYFEEKTPYKMTPIVAAGTP